MSFLQFFRILWARRFIIVGSTLACFGIALLIAKLLPARYEADSRVMLDVVKPDPVTGQVIATQFARAYTKTQTELIRDYRVTGAVVDALNWTSSPQLVAEYNARPSGDTRDLRRWLAAKITEGVSAKLIEGSNILEITFSTTSPETARVVADAVRAAYIDQSLAFKREGAMKTAAWYDGQVLKVRGELAQADARKTAFERTNRIVLQEDQSDTESARLRALSSAVAAPVTPAAAAAAAPIGPSATLLGQVDAQIATLATTLGPNHPQLVALRQQRTAVAAAAARERAASRPAAIAASGPSLAGQVAAQTGRVIAQRDKVENLRRLAADVTVLRDQYTKTAARAADLRQEAESNETGLTLLGSAVAPEDPVFPNMPLIIIGSLALGLGLGVLASLGLELASRRVRGVEDLAVAGVPVIIVLSGAGQPTARRPSLTQRLGLTHARPA